jgi:hypothetical protein
MTQAGQTDVSDSMHIDLASIIYGFSPKHW